MKHPEADERKARDPYNPFAIEYCAILGAAELPDRLLTLAERRVGVCSDDTLTAVVPVDDEPEAPAPDYFDPVTVYEEYQSRPPVGAQTTVPGLDSCTEVREALSKLSASLALPAEQTAVDETASVA